MAKLASGETKMLPLEEALKAYLGKSQAEATQLTEKLRKLAEEATQRQLELEASRNDGDDPNKSGPQDGTGVNPRKKGSKTGLINFRSENNKTQGEK